MLLRRDDVRNKFIYSCQEKHFEKKKEWKKDYKHWFMAVEDGKYSKA